MRKVSVKYMFQNRVEEEFVDMGVFYEERGVVVVCDSYGDISVHNAKPAGDGVVIVAEGAEQLSGNNPEFVIDLIMSGI